MSIKPPFAESMDINICSEIMNWQCVGDLILIRHLGLDSSSNASPFPGDLVKPTSRYCAGEVGVVICRTSSHAFVFWTPLEEIWVAT
jgi:hypothetical protein